MIVESGQRFLLIGDSITDAGRLDDPEQMGFGYVRMLRDLLWVRYPDRAVEIVNRGIGGDTVRLLAARWKRDVLEMKPDVLSVSIGVNDVWRQLETPANPEEVLLDEFESTYHQILGAVRSRLGCKLFLCQATIIGETREAPHNPIIDKYNTCIQGLATEFDACLVPMNQAFWRVIDADASRKWTMDGVHPLSNGHMLMATTLFEALDETLP